MQEKAKQRQRFSFSPFFPSTPKDTKDRYSDNNDDEDSQSRLTLWQSIMGGDNQAIHTRRTLSFDDEEGPIAADAIEQHRSKKEAAYAREQKRAARVSTVQKQSPCDTRGDDSQGGGNSLWARLRCGKSRDGAMKSLDDEIRDQADPATKTDDQWSATNSVTEIAKITNDSSQRSAVYRMFGSDPLNQIHVEETSAIPQPTSPRHVVVKITASTINIQDCIIRRGLDYNLTEPVGLPATSGHDFVGFVIKCGSKAHKFKPGDRVAGLVRSGGNARYIQESEDGLVSVPKDLDGAEAACMVSIYTAAYQCINLATKHTSVYDLEGKNVLVVGGMDGIGQAIIQMCSKAKAIVFATAPDRRHAYVRSILKATPLPENSDDWVPVGKHSMDVVFDGICDGALESSYEALKPTGRLICFGQSSLLTEKMGWFGVPVERRLQRVSIQTQSNVSVHDIWDSFRSDPELFKRNLQSLFQLLQMKKIRPQIARRVGLDEVGLSHRKLEQGQVRGTIVCLPWKRVSRRNIRNLDDPGLLAKENKE